MNIYTKFVARLQLDKAIREAEEAHHKDGDRYYVMPTFNGTKGKPVLIILNRFNFRKLRHKGYIKPQAKIIDLLNECFYFTAQRDGTGYMDKHAKEVKRASYFSWYEAERKAIKANKKRLRKNKR